MFKVGDRVICVDNSGLKIKGYLKIGEEYTITKVYMKDDIRYEVKHDNGLPFGCIKPFRLKLFKKSNTKNYI